MNWKEKVFKGFRLYAVTSLERDTDSILTQIEDAYKGGVDIVQLRSKALSDSSMLRLGKKIRQVAIHSRKLFFVNDRIDIALALEADGVHLGQDDMPLTEAKKLIRRSGVKLRIGKSTHSLKQAQSSIVEKPDYIGVGPIFETPTKPSYDAVGLQLIRQVSSQISIPFVAIGGIDINNIDSVLQAGATRVAVVRAIFSNGDSYDAAKKLRIKIESQKQI